MFSFRTTPLEDQMDKALMGGKVGCFCTQNCWDTVHDRYMYQLFSERGNLDVVFQPMEAELTPGTNHIGFDPERLRGLSAVVVEIQDVGSRYFNYTRDVFRLMSVLRDFGDDSPALYIVDHPNPAGRFVEGSIPEGQREEFVPKVAHRHGLTLGELCNLYYAEIGPVSASRNIGSVIGLEQGPHAVDHSSCIGYSRYVHFLRIQWRGTVEQYHDNACDRNVKAVRVFRGAIHKTVHGDSPGS